MNSNRFAIAAVLLLLLSGCGETQKPGDRPQKPVAESVDLEQRLLSQPGETKTCVTSGQSVTVIWPSISEGETVRDYLVRLNIENANAWRGLPLPIAAGVFRDCLSPWLNASTPKREDR